MKSIHDFTFSLGETPSYGERFGVERRKKKIVFGDWIDQLETSFKVEHQWTMLLTREAFWFFLDDQYFGNGLTFLSDMILNFMACAYISNDDASATVSFIVDTIRRRFMPLEEEVSQKDNDLLLDVLTLLDSVLLQNISPKMILSTYNHFVDDFSQEEYETGDIVQDITRYLTHTSEQIAAPIVLKPNVLATIKELIAGGFRTSTQDIGKKLGKEQSTISHRLVKISKTYVAEWRKRINWSKLGLHTHVFYVTLPLNQEEEFVRGLAETQVRRSHLRRKRRR